MTKTITPEGATEIVFKDPIYDTTIVFLTDFDHTKFQEIMLTRHGLKTDPLDPGGAWTIRCGPDGSEFLSKFFIAIYWKFTFTPANLALLAHECFHITSHTLRNRGMNLSNDSEEAFAYHHNFVFQTLLTALKAKLTQPQKPKKKTK